MNNNIDKKIEYLKKEQQVIEDSKHDSYKEVEMYTLFYKYKSVYSDFWCEDCCEDVKFSFEHHGINKKTILVNDKGVYKADNLLLFINNDNDNELSYVKNGFFVKKRYLYN